MFVVIGPIAIIEMVYGNCRVDGVWRFGSISFCAKGVSFYYLFLDGVKYESQEIYHHNSCDYGSQLNHISRRVHGGF